MYLTACLVFPEPGGCLYLENLGAIESNKSRHDATTQPNHSARHSTCRHDTTRALGVRSKNSSSGNSIEWETRLGGGISTSLPLLTGGKAGPSPSPSPSLASPYAMQMHACNLEQPAAASSLHWRRPKCAS